MRIFLIVILTSLCFCSYSQSSIVVEKIYSPNTQIYINDSVNSVVTISKVYADNTLSEDYTLKDNDFIDDIIPDFTYTDGLNKKAYFIFTEYSTKNPDKELLEITKSVSVLKDISNINTKTYKKVEYSKSAYELFNQCNDGIKDIVETKLIESVGDYGIVYRKYKKKETIEIIYVDCSYLTTIEIDPKNIRFNKFNNNLLLLYNGEDLIFLHNKNN